MALEPIIRVRNLTNRFGKAVIHQHLDLDVIRGEVLGVVGASGSGKSVLLRSIVGLQRPSAGSITVLGTEVLTADAASLRKVQNRWGVMFQDGALFSSLTVRENVAAPMRERMGIDAETRNALADLRIVLCASQPDRHLERSLPAGGAPVLRRSPHAGDRAPRAARCRAQCTGAAVAAVARRWRATLRSRAMM